MSNPIISVSGSVPSAPDPETIRQSYSKIVYSEEKFFVYGDGEESGGNFDPITLGQRFFIFLNMDDVLASTRPDFIELETWNKAVKKAASGFVTPNFSIMPKVLIPSETTILNLVDNGIAAIPVNKKEFNWSVSDLNAGGPVTEAEDVANIMSISTQSPNSVSVNAKNEGIVTDDITIKLVDGDAGSDGAETIARGAQVLFFNITPNVTGSQDEKDVAETTWTMSLTSGEIQVEAKDSAPAILIVSGGDSEPNQGQANLSDAQMKEGPRHVQYLKSGISFVVLLYPVWNGVIISSGIQDAQGLQTVSGTFVPKTKGASIFSDTYSAPFDPTAPDEVVVSVDSDVKVDFGTEITVEFENCRAQVAYEPCFFSKELHYDEFFLAPDDIPSEVSFDFDVFPIWTDNDTGATLTGASSPTSFTGEAGTNTTFWKAPWRGSATDFFRFGMEVFGEFLRAEEDRVLSIRNSNGTFNLSWTGGTPAGTSSTEDDYILSASVTVGQEGSSGQVVYDKYGLAGTDAVPIQSIGAFPLSMAGGFGTVTGAIFKGLAMGIADNDTPDGATWTIPLVGLEQKLNDIALINTPFFDNFAASTAIDFLSRYGGVSWTAKAGANTSTKLTASDDISSPFFDFANGTPVSAALAQVMENSQNTYVIEDGTMKVFGINASTGLPISSGQDWQSSYPNVEVLMNDRRPIFDNLRNEIVVIGLEQIIAGSGKDIANIPLFPKIGVVSQSTTPEIEWAKSLVAPVQGHLDDARIEIIADRLGAVSRSYDVTGRVQIPGNASIELYDSWGDLLISSYTHNYDSQAKTWTTDLELVSGT